MAKKGGQVQLQVDISTEEDWEKLMEREGLIIVDVYSDWCGPCTAMSANLKKLKLEIGGDNLHLAMAKSDNIECLKRFREKSEPTWMFIANGKMVNLMFGANAPKLTRLIIDELKREEAIREGLKTREEMDIMELAPEEQVRHEAFEKERLEGEAIEKEAKLKAKDERLKLVVNCILQTFSGNGVFVIFPYAADKLSMVHDLWDSGGIKPGHIEKISFKDINVDDLLYFTDYRFPESVLELATAGNCSCYMVKVENPEDNDNVDNIVLSAVYGTSQQPPGSQESFALKMRTLVKRAPQESEGEDKTAENSEEEELDGVWVPPNKPTRALALYMLFPSHTSSHVPPEPEPIPPHIAVAYDAIKRSEVMALIDEYPKDVLRFGFFTDEKPETAKLIAKTVIHFEKKAEETTYGEKLIVQLSKTHSDTVLAFAQLGPSYMSPNTVEGEKECKLFFPKDYDEPEIEEVEPTAKKKPKRKKKGPPPPEGEEEKSRVSEEVTSKSSFIEGEEAGERTDFAPEMEEEGDEEETASQYEEGDEGEEMPEEADKATSPMTDEMEHTASEPANELVDQKTSETIVTPTSDKAAE
ncbi:hypothetical protein Trydic_g8092 [Trypoxylus dichotomus]